jgi:hypothetical protein
VDLHGNQQSKAAVLSDWKKIGCRRNVPADCTRPAKDAAQRAGAFGQSETGACGFMNDELERVASELVTQGVHPQLNRNAADWDCTLWCGNGWKGSMPMGSGGTALAAVQAAVICRNEILEQRKAG